MLVTMMYLFSLDEKQYVRVLNGKALYIYYIYRSPSPRCRWKTLSIFKLWNLFSDNLKLFFLSCSIFLSLLSHSLSISFALSLSFIISLVYLFIYLRFKLWNIYICIFIIIFCIVNSLLMYICKRKIQN